MRIIDIKPPPKILRILIGLRLLVAILKERIGKAIKIAEIGPFVRKPAERETQNNN